jgi:PAS domain S-box-containing protein
MLNMPDNSYKWENPKNKFSYGSENQSSDKKSPYLMYKELFEISNDAIIILNTGFRLIDTNKKACELLGCSKEELTGTSALSLNLKDEFVKLKKETKNLLNAPFYAETKIQAKEGNKIPVGVILGRIDDSENAVSYAIMKDLREAKQPKPGITSLTKKISLTDNEKKVLYGIVKYPSYNDIELSRELGIKRSTITSIKNKLRKNNFYSSYRIPDFSLLGCEMLAVMYAKLNPMTQHEAKKSCMLRETTSVPEQVYLSATNRELVGFCISKNLTDFKKHMDNIIRKYKGYDLIEDINLIYFPFETSKFENLFDYSPLLAKLFGLGIKEKPKKTVKQVKRELTDKEKVILYALVKFPELNDSEIAEKTGLPRPSISQTRRRLTEDGFLATVNIPDPIRLRCELATLSHTKFNPKISLDTIKKGTEYMKSSPSSTFMVAGDVESCSIDVFNDYTEHETKHNKDVKFYRENNLITENPVTIIFPLPQIQLQNLDFSPLVGKILGLKAGF